MTTYVERCMIVPAADADLARALCDGVAPGQSGDGMFVRAVSVSGSLPATDYISSGMIGADFAALLPLTSFDADGVATTAPGQPAVIVALAAQAGVSVTLMRINAMLASIDVTQQDPYTALARLGRQLVQIAQDTP